jgi:hypothetical protein
MRNVSDKSCRKNQHTALYAQETFFPKIVPFMIYVDKYGAARQVTGKNMVHERYDLHGR